MNDWHVKAYANDIRFPSHIMVLEKEAEEDDILSDRKGVRCAGYLSNGMDCGAHVEAVDSGQTLRTQKIEEG